MKRQKTFIEWMDTKADIAPPCPDALDEAAAAVAGLLRNNNGELFRIFGEQGAAVSNAFAGKFMDDLARRNVEIRRTVCENRGNECEFSNMEVE